MKMKLITLVVGLMATGSVFAKDVSFEQFQESCKNPAEFGNQNAPSKIDLTCAQTETSWEGLESGSTDLKVTRVITGTARSDKDLSSSDTFELPVPSRSIECPVYKKVINETSIDVALTCEKVIGEGVTLETLCEAELNNNIRENPSIVKKADAGETYSVCQNTRQKD